MSDIPTPAESIHALLTSLRLTPPRLIQSPPTQPRRASVALIIRMKPSPELAFQGRVPEGWTGEVIPEEDFGIGYTIEDFFALPWVNHPGTVPELLFIRRSPSHSPNSNSGAHRWSSHIAFPGGRHEATDESALYTALRETWEEIGMDLAEREFVQVGRLDEREITTSLGKRLLMILSPFGELRKSTLRTRAHASVFLQTSPFSSEPELQATEVSSVHWIPLSTLTPPFPEESKDCIEIDISTRLSPRNQFVRWALRGLVGKMQFTCILLPDEPDHVAEGFDNNMDFAEPPEGGSGSWLDKRTGKRVLRLWGLSLGMTLDLVAHLPADTPAPLSTAASKSSSPTRQFGPRTPVTVTSSFDAQWDAAQRELAAGRGGSVSPILTSDPLPETKGSEAGSVASRTNGHGLKTAVKGMKGRRRRGVGPNLKSVFPTFSHVDVDFWIWVFGRRYRQVLKGWEASLQGPDRSADRRMNWSGAALSTFYSAVRHAIVVAIILRLLAMIGGVGVAGWLFWKYSKAMGLGEL
ncbi:hypothetical protein DB88DRAFT_481029 [Papiliotrema laurentii]|uniref:Nudix hydrolase domain-containing protein n=1 Tax=Papiliotrema laurentii TaxID=5418 RepID=A0AAD9L864_PAPLA|nr:hypothetical protein DB88DRAFT_481029 [Papiliotrema laurentii]